MLLSLPVVLHTHCLQPRPDSRCQYPPRNVGIDEKATNYWILFCIHFDNGHIDVQLHFHDNDIVHDICYRIDFANHMDYNDILKMENRNTLS